MRTDLRLIAVALAGILSACTKTSPQQAGDGGSQKPQEGSFQTGSGNANNNGSGKADSGQSKIDSTQVASIPVSVSLPQLKDRDVSTDKWTYTVSYAGTDKKGDVTVQGTQASMTITELPSGKTGTFTLALERNAVTAYSGSVDNVTLIAGANTLQITLKPISTVIPSVTILPTITVPPSVTPPPPIAPPGDPTPTVVPTTSIPADPSKVSFSRDLKPIFDKNCSECHHTGKSLDLTQMPSGNLGGIVDSILQRATSTTMPMPPAPRDRLDQAALDKITQWKQQGFQP